MTLIKIDAVFQAYTSHTTRAFGMCKLDLNVSELICKDKFFVTLPEMQDVLIILGRTWQRKYNCFLDWNCKLAHCQSANNHLWVPLRQLEESYATSIIPILVQLNSEENTK